MTVGPICNGRTGGGRIFHDCMATPKYRVHQPAGNAVRERWACSRHLVQLVARMTVPGSEVTVQRLGR